MCQHSIANIDINKDYDESLGTEEVHYQSFSRMAAFFGRDMQAHRHDRYFQMHYLDTGQIELQLDDHRYSVQAPLFVITPPSVPHAFITESDSDGHGLTVHEELIWPLLEVLYPGTRETFGLPGICLSLADKPDELAALAHYWQLIRRESTAQLPGREHTLALLAQAVFTLLLRNAKLDDHAASGMRGELKLFQRFNQMIDSHYHQHWTVPDYARELHLTESRLTDICRRFANRSPKRLIFDRQLREAKRLGIPTILLTQAVDSRFSQEAQVVIDVPRGGDSSRMPLHGTVLVCLEMMVLSVASTTPQKTVKSLKRINDRHRAIGKSGGKRGH